MNNSLMPLYITAATIGFMHTLFGPDHYLPFIVMSRARKWPFVKTGIITFLCGLGHVMSSVVLGTIGIMFGIAVMKLEAFEAFRGNLAGWVLMAFGLTYLIWGIRKAIKNKPHTHSHIHLDSQPHSHTHSHADKHAHVHGEEKANITPWVLFTIFVLGPCEPLIPILMYPAAKSSASGVIAVAVIFSVVTIVTMLSVVLILSFGINLIPLRRVERYSHVIAGVTILLCGIAIQMGL